MSAASSIVISGSNCTYTCTVKSTTVQAYVPTSHKAYVREELRRKRHTVVQLSVHTITATLNIYTTMTILHSKYTSLGTVHLNKNQVQSNPSNQKLFPP